MFRQWFTGDMPEAHDPDVVTVREAIAAAIVRRRPLAGDRSLNAFRLLNGESERVPGLDIDVFGEHLVAWFAEEIDPSLRERIVDFVSTLGARGVYIKIRPAHASRVSPSRRALLAPRGATRGADASPELLIQERAFRFLVRLGDGLLTGLFLDQRDNRAWLARHARGRRVLNLFAYSCSFTVAAACSGAIETVSVDVSAKALRLGQRNLEVNSLDKPGHHLERDDVMHWLRRAHAAGREFDIVVLDPPSFSTTSQSRFSVERDFAHLAHRCVEVVSPKGGMVLACVNRRAVSHATLARWMSEAVTSAGRHVIRITPRPSQLDFPPPACGEPHMKAVTVQIGPAR